MRLSFRRYTLQKCHLAVSLSLPASGHHAAMRFDILACRHPGRGSLVRRMVCWSVLALASAWTSAVRAGDAPPDAAAWQRAFDQAWQRSALAQVTAPRQEEARSRELVAQRLTPAPGRIMVGHLQDRFNQNVGRREWELAWSSPLWLPGQRAARQAEASQMAAEVDAQLAVQRWQLAGELRERWWNLASAREALALADQRLTLASQLHEAVQRRFKAGDLARTDANLSASDELAARMARLQAQAAVSEAEQAFKAFTGEQPPAVLVTEPPPAALVSLDDHPRIQALQAMMQTVQARLTLLDASRREAPEIALRWTQERSDAHEPYRQAVGVSWTLPLQADARHRQEGAALRAELAQLESEMIQVRRQLEQAQFQGEQAMRSLQTQLGLARQQQDLAHDSLRWARKAFELGESDLSTLLRVQGAAREADAEVSRLQWMGHQAVSMLRQAQGVLP
jgi:outer membrane protein TolC